MQINLGFAKQQIPFSVSENRLLGVLTPNNVPVSLTGEDEVIRALDAPIGSDKIENIVHRGQKVCIITSDITRPMPSKIVLPPLLKRLLNAGIEKKNIVIVFALGSHRKHTEEEKILLVGQEIYDSYTLLDNDESYVKYLGHTSAGTRVDIFKPVADADVRIALGNIEYHYFAGYSGGSKAIMPGVSTCEAIRQNHSMMVNSEAKAGNLNSPVRKDIDEVCEKLLPIDFIVNVVLDEHKKIIKCVAGDYIKAHREGCKFLDSLYKIPIKEQADIVIVSAGGYPKDQNMYQAQKALDNAKHAVKKGGVIIWLASCDEGFGSATFEKWMTSFSPDEMISEIKRNFVLGGHKAAAIALVKKNADIFLVSSLSKELVLSINLTPFSTLDAAFAAATEKTGNNGSVLIMPYGGSTLPVIQ